jgi:hypothetical protein
MSGTSVSELRYQRPSEFSHPLGGQGTLKQWQDEIGLAGPIYNKPLLTQMHLLK